MRTMVEVLEEILVEMMYERMDGVMVDVIDVMMIENLRWWMR